MNGRDGNDGDTRGEELCSARAWVAIVLGAVRPVVGVLASCGTRRDCCARQTSHILERYMLAVMVCSYRWLVALCRCVITVLQCLMKLFAGGYGDDD